MFMNTEIFQDAYCCIWRLEKAVKKHIHPEYSFVSFAL